MTKPRVWFIRPQWHWFGPATLLPFYVGSDEWDRVTVVLGWTVTGRVVIALWRDWYADIPAPTKRRPRLYPLDDVAAEFGIDLEEGH